MNNPEQGSNKEPNSQEQGQRFVALLNKLAAVRQKYIEEYYAEIHPELSLPPAEEQQEMFYDFETFEAEPIIKKLGMNSLGWFATPETSNSSASDLDASGDLFIDTQNMEITRWETTAASEIDSAQFTTEMTIKLDINGEIVIEKDVVRESLGQRGYPSMDEAVEGVGEPRHPSGGTEPMQTEKEEVDYFIELLKPDKAKKIMDDLSRLVDGIIKLYQDRSR